MGISWTATNNALDDDLHSLLARKDAENQMNMKIAAQFQDQQEAAANQQLRQAQIDAQREARQAAIAQQKASQVSLDDQRKATAEKARADATAKETSTKEAAAHKSQLEALVADPNADPDMKKAAAWELAGLKYKPADVTSENATVPVIRVNPRTGKTEQVGKAPKGAHFVTEPAPPAAPNLHFQIGMGPDGQPVTMGIDPKTGKVINSNVTAAPPTVDARNRASALEAAKPVFDQMDQLISKINTHNGLYATAAGTAAKLAAKSNLDNDVAEYNALLHTYAPVILRAHGLLRPQNDQINAFVNEAAVQPTDNSDLAMRKMRNLRKIGARMAAAFTQTDPDKAAEAAIQGSAVVPNAKSGTLPGAAKPPAMKFGLDANGNLVEVH